jgi:hypothetical protein
MLTPAQRRLADLMLAGQDQRACMQRLSLSRSGYNNLVRGMLRALECQRDELMSVLRGERRTPERTIQQCRERPRQWWTV